MTLPKRLLFGTWIVLLPACGDDAESSNGTDGAIGSETEPSGQEGTSSASASSDESSGVDDSTSGGDTEGHPGELPPALGVQIVAGGGFSCSLDGDGVRTCWGEDSSGQIGDAMQRSGPPRRIAGEPTWAVIAGTDDTACAIDREGALYCWGNNREGQVGHGMVDGNPPRPVLAPVAVGGDERFIDVSIGSGHGCAIASDRRLWCWGINDDGQIGDGSRGPTWSPQVPVPAAGDMRFLDVSAAGSHTCGITIDGSLWCWGSNRGGALGDPMVTFSSLPRRIGEDLDWQTVHAGEGDATCAVKDDGSLWCWGATTSGQLGVEPAEPGADLTEPTAVLTEFRFTDFTLGRSIACGIAEDGSLWCWGADYTGIRAAGTHEKSSSNPTPIRVGGRNDWKNVRIGFQHACALDLDDRVWCWGRNNSGEVGNGTSGMDTTVDDGPQEVGVYAGQPPAEDVVAVTSGPGNACILGNDGRLHCWGGRAGGQLPPLDEPPCSPTTSCYVTVPHTISGTGFTAVAIGFGFLCALAENGAISCWGSGYGTTEDELDTPAPLGTDDGFTSIEAGSGSACAIRAPGQLHCWGDNSRGEVGNGSMIAVTTPTRIGTDEDWTRVHLGESHACGIRAGGLYCWGSNDRGQLGLGTTGVDYLDTSADVYVPTAVGTASDWTEISAGRRSTCGLRSGQLWCWGSSFTEPDNGPSEPAEAVTEPLRVGTDEDWQQVGCAESVACMLKPDGSLWCFGRSYGGLAGGTPGIEEVVTLPRRIGTRNDFTSLSTGGTGERACAMASGTAVCWGGGFLGDHNVFESSELRRVVAPLP